VLKQIDVRHQSLSIKERQDDGFIADICMVALLSKSTPHPSISILMLHQHGQSLNERQNTNFVAANDI